MNEPRPRYQTIEDWLTEQCKALPAGSLLPSEPELALRFSVSRMTARQAVQNLANAGLVERRRGAGTFVAPPLLHRREGLLLSFTEDMRQRGMKSSSRVLSADILTSPEDAVGLGLAPTAWIVKLVRVRFGERTPIAIETVCLPGEFSRVLEYDLENGSLHEALRAMGRQIGYARGHVMARLATDREAETLELTPPAALLVESRSIFDSTDRPLERTQTAYVASRWVIDTGTYAPSAGLPSSPSATPSASSSAAVS